MTICVAVKVNDALVFVTDSASSSVVSGVNGDQVVVRVYNHGHKLFNLIRDKPVAGMTCGLGNFGASSISSIAKSIRKSISSGECDFSTIDYTVEQVATYCAEIFNEKYKELPEEIKQQSSFNFFIGGYSSTSESSELWKFSAQGMADGNLAKIAGENDCNIFWDGQPEACVRLVLGISPSLKASLIDAGISDEDAQLLVDKIIKDSSSSLIEPSMPVQDAIDLAKFLAQTTVSYVRFLPGANTVGGELDIATVTKFEGYRWINRKHYYPAILNKETNHE